MINNYIDITVRLLENILDNEADYVKEAGAKVAESIENDGVIHLFGCGHSHILTEEYFIAQVDWLRFIRFCMNHLCFTKELRRHLYWNEKMIMRKHLWQRKISVLAIS